MIKIAPFLCMSHHLHLFTNNFSFWQWQNVHVTCYLFEHEQACTLTGSNMVPLCCTIHLCLLFKFYVFILYPESPQKNNYCYRMGMTGDDDIIIALCVDKKKYFDLYISTIIIPLHKITRCIPPNCELLWSANISITNSRH